MVKCSVQLALHLLRIASLAASIATFAAINDFESRRWEWPMTLNTVAYPIRELLQYTYTVRLDYIALGIASWDFLMSFASVFMGPGSTRLRLFCDVVRLPGCTMSIGVLCGMSDTLALVLSVAVQLMTLLAAQNTDKRYSITLSTAAVQCVFLPTIFSWYFTYHFVIAGNHMPWHILSATFAYFLISTYPLRDYISVYTLWILYLTTMNNNTEYVMYAGIVVGSFSVLWTVAPSIYSASKTKTR